MNNYQVSTTQLRRAIAIKEKIEALESELAEVLGSPSPTVSAGPTGRKKNRMSAAGRAAIRAAQKRRWAKMRGKEPVSSGRARMSSAARARMAAAAKRRWAAAKAAGRNQL